MRFHSRSRCVNGEVEIRRSPDRMTLQKNGVVNTVVYDSTVYRQPYAVHGVEDVPSDMSSLFARVESTEPLHLFSFFIPKFDSGGFRKARDSRARMLRLTFNELQIFSSSGRPESCNVMRVPLSEILFYETGTRLLKSWFTIAVVHSEKMRLISVPYTTRWESYFITLCRQMILSEITPGYELLRWDGISSDRLQQIESRWVAECRRAFFSEWPILAIAAQPTVYGVHHWFKKAQTSGRCLCLYPEFLVWLDEENEERHMEYGLVRRIIPLSRIESLEIHQNGAGNKHAGELRLHLQWKRAKSVVRIPINLELKDACFEMAEKWRQLKSREYRFL